MRVAIVNQPIDTVLPPGQNSIGIWTYEVARRLVDRCDVTVFSRWSRAAAAAGHAADSRVDGVRYRLLRGVPNRVWTRIAGWVEPRRRRRTPFYASPMNQVDFTLRVAWEIARGGFDVVHVHNSVGTIPILRRAAPNAKLVLHMNGEWLSQLDRTTMDARIELVDQVIGSSDHITGLVRDRFPHHADKCATVYNGVDVTAFTPRHSGPRPAEHQPGSRVVFVGRISPEKGLHDLIDAVVSLADDRPDIQLDLVGPPGVIPLEYLVGVGDEPEVAALARFYEGDYLADLEARVPERHRACVRFVGPMAHDAVVELVGEADVLANTSYSESFGMSLVEAMACELPVVATRVGGMKEIVEDGLTGRLVRRGDVGAIAGAIAELLDDPSLCESMGRAGRVRVVELFAWEAVADALVERYEDLVRPLLAQRELA